MELYTAIFTANKFTARSKTFYTDICPKLLFMIHGPTTSLPVKLKLLPIRARAQLGHYGSPGEVCLPVHAPHLNPGQSIYLLLSTL